MNEPANRMTPDLLSEAILRALARAPGEGGMSLPRLGKQLGQGASAVMRQLTLMGDTTIGRVRGPGWVRVEQGEGRWVAHLTDEGRVFVAMLPAEEKAA